MDLTSPHVGADLTLRTVLLFIFRIFRVLALSKTHARVPGSILGRNLEWHVCHTCTSARVRLSQLIWLVTHHTSEIYIRHVYFPEEGPRNAYACKFINNIWTRSHLFIFTCVWVAVSVFWPQMMICISDMYVSQLKKEAPRPGFEFCRGRRKRFDWSSEPTILRRGILNNIYYVLHSKYSLTAISSRMHRISFDLQS